MRIVQITDLHLYSDPAGSDDVSHPIQRAFESKREFFVQFLKCFGIFYLYDYWHIIGHSYAHPSGQLGRTPGRMNVRLRAGRYGTKRAQNERRNAS